MDWLKGRLQAVFDHIIGGLALLGVVALVAATGGAIVVWGGRSVAIEWWEIILLIAILIAIVSCLIVLFRRGAQNQPTREKGPHSDLLLRLEALEVDFTRGPGYVGWVVAQQYNAMLSQAISECPTQDFQSLTPAEPGTDRQYATIDRPTLLALVRQLRSIVESA